VGTISKVILVALSENSNQHPKKKKETVKPDDASQDTAFKLSEVLFNCSKAN
jgi:hypothetical protein